MRQLQSSGIPGRLLAVVLAAAFAAPAFADTVVYECRLGSVTKGKARKTFDDTAAPSQRFALNVAKGRGCLIVGDACDMNTGRLDVEQDETSIVAKGRSEPLLLTYMLTRNQFVLIRGDETTSSRRDDCHEIALQPEMPY